MTPRRGRGGRANNQNQSNNNNLMAYDHSGQYLAQYPTDATLQQMLPTYNTSLSDKGYYYPDMPQQQQQYQDQESAQPPPPPRSNEELNLSVLRRHNPSVASILSLAPYVVVYTFSPITQQWEKNGIEGTMFICQLTQGSYGEERYSVFVLNRRGLNNFDILLTDGDNVEITDEFVILKAERESEVRGLSNNVNNNNLNNNTNNNNNNNGGGNENTSHIIGLWIYSEPPPNSTAETRKINAEVIKECAIHAGRSMVLAKETQQQQQQQHVYSSVPMGRQISLKELFGQQRVQDEHGAEMVWGHGPPPADQLPTSTAQAMNHQQQQQSGNGGNVLTDLFRKAGLVNPS